MNADLFKRIKEKIENIINLIVMQNGKNYITSAIG